MGTLINSVIENNAGEDRAAASLYFARRLLESEHMYPRTPIFEVLACDIAEAFDVERIDRFMRIALLGPDSVKCQKG